MSLLVSSLYRPKSFFNLVLLGFVLVTMPLIAGMIAGGVYVDRLLVQSEFAVYRASQASQVIRAMLEELPDMERNARQYVVLKDEVLLHNYTERHEKFRKNASDLGELADADVLRSQLDELIAREDGVFQYVTAVSSAKAKAAEKKLPIEKGQVQKQARADKVEDFNLETAFVSLNELAQSLKQESHGWISNQVLLLQSMAGKTKRVLIWQTLLLGGATLIVAIFLSSRITRPIRQVDAAIRQLGDGEFANEISIRGPRDIQILGERLDWLRHRLLELEEKKGAFLRHVSHELKTPLTAMREGTALLAEGLLGKLSQPQKEITDVLQRNTLVLQRMIENLLNFNMVQAKRTVLSIGDVRLEEIVADVTADHKLAMMAKKLRLNSQCRKVRMQGDREKLRVVIDNLLSNAIKYSPDNTELIIHLRSDGKNAVLDVLDRGPGVKPEEQDRVFDAFYRGNSTPKSDIRGSGLGLSIAKEFVDLHQGVIEVISEERPGAHFRVTLPVQAAQAVA